MALHRRGRFFLVPARLDDPMAVEPNPQSREPRLPRRARPDALRIREQPEPLGLRRQRRELRKARVIRREHRLFPVQDRRIAVGRINPIGHLPRVEIDSPARRQRRKRLVEEARIGEQRELAAAQPELDHVERIAVEPSQRARRVHRLSQHGRQIWQQLHVRIHPIRHPLAHGEQSHLPRERRTIHPRVSYRSYVITSRP